MRSILFSLTIATVLFILNSCKKDKDNVEIPELPANESESITTLKLIFSPQGGGNNITYQFKDTDGPGGNPPKQDTIKLADSTTFYVVTEFWDESKSTAVNITPEIQSEKDDHIIGYIHAGLNLTTEVLDKDSKNLPIGLSSKWVSLKASNGTTKIVLKHQPDTKDGTLNSGETDMEITFITVIK